MNLVSKLHDKRINAYNVLVEISIKEYVDIAKQITTNNEYQRKRVKGSSMVYKLLRDDLKKGCLIPPIVLAVRKENTPNQLDINENISNEDILKLIKSGGLIILDGLQRTHTILDVVKELGTTNEKDILIEVEKNIIRIEVYLGLNKIGILYRMLTLNTGQTPMSIRHQIEILYSDYLSNDIHGIKFLREVDEGSPQEIGEYKFRDVIEGFNSYLNKDELGIKRSDVSENIENLEALSTENKDEDIFEEFILSHFNLTKKMESLTGSWSITVDAAKAKNAFGKSILEIFSKPQVLSGFGAAIGKLREFKLIQNFNEVREYIEKIEFEGDSNEGMDLLLGKLSKIKNSARNIGASQRLFLTYFFRELFNKESDSFLKINTAINKGFDKYHTQL